MYYAIRKRRRTGRSAAGSRPRSARPEAAASSPAPTRMTAEQAVARIRSGQHVILGSGAAEPQSLVEALAARREQLFDVEVQHLLTLGAAPYAAPEFQGHIRHNALFIGPNVRSAIGVGTADYTPCYLSEIPELIRIGHIRVDAALIQVAPPRNGECSLGISVDILKAAVEAASYVVAQVNPRMPWTAGGSRIPMSEVDAVVEGEAPLLELPGAEVTAAALGIGRYVTALVPDGATIQAGIGSVPDAVLAALSAKKDLGVHSEMISDGMLSLLEKGVINGRRKTLDRGKIVGSFCLGSRRLYEAAAASTFELHPVDYVNDPWIIARNDRMMSINSALQIDLTRQVAADSIGRRFYSGVGGQVDFIRGAARAKEGRSIIAMPSTAQRGAVSRIVCCLGEGTGVVTTRADVDFVVTEYGIAALKGRTIRERALALIQLAHPSFRERLAAEAKRLGYLDASQALPPLESGPYRVELECRRRFGDREIFFRPIQPTDERLLKDLFYSQSMRTTFLRFGIPLKRLSEQQFQELVAIDYRNSMAIGAFADGGGGGRLIGVGRYGAGPGEKTAEAAVTVHDDFQGRGVGAFLLDYLAWIARENGLEALTVEVFAVNRRMRRLLERCFAKVQERELGRDAVRVTARLADWKGKGNPAHGLGAPARRAETR